MSDMDEGDIPYVGRYCKACGCSVSLEQLCLNFYVCRECGVRPMIAEIRYPYDNPQGTRPNPHVYDPKKAKPEVQIPPQALRELLALLQLQISIDERSLDALIGDENIYERIVNRSSAHAYRKIAVLVEDLLKRFNL